MGFFSALFEFLTGASNAVRNDCERKSADYSAGYSRGAESASSMSDDELRSELRRANQDGISGMKNAGKTRAMVDEYNNRKNN